MHEHRLRRRRPSLFVTTAAAVALVACAPERDRRGRDLSVEEGDLAISQEGDLRRSDLAGPGNKDGALPTDLASSDAGGATEDLAAAGDLAFPQTDLRESLVPGDTCLDAPLLPVGVVVEGTSDDASFADDYHDWGKSDLGATPCNSVTAFQYDAVDAVYKVEVPAGKTLRVRAQSQLGWDLAVALFASCAAPAASCLVDADDALPIGNPESVEHTNSSGATETIFVLIDGWDTTEKGAFTVQAELQ